jgi:hypothetical protein
MGGLATLVLALLAGASVVEAHSGARAVIPVPLELDTVTSEAVPAPVVSASDPWPGATLVLVGAAGIAAAAGCLRRRQRLAVFLSLAVAVFAGETALHSVHHLNEPQQAERCPVYAASVHVAGLEAGPATPELPPPARTPNRSLAGNPQRLTGVLAGPPSRAPPGHPA